MKKKYEQLKKRIYEGARGKNLVITDTVLDRVSYELAVIETQELADYFILYYRVIEACNDLNLLRTPGRGSAASSLVNYCLDITKINPISDGLVFERFINPNLSQSPDIDIDIPKGERENVINKLKQKYPEYHTYVIACLPNKARNWKSIFYKDCTYQEHPCGIIITEKKLSDSVFFHKDKKYYLTTDLYNDPLCVNRIDLVELDYLNKLQLIVDKIDRKIHPYDLPLDDEKVFEFFSMGNLENIFMFDSPAFERLLTTFKLCSITDLSIINAMFRPGAMDFIPKMVENKLNIKKHFYFNAPGVSEILKETYNLPIYQESFLHLSKEIGGISYAETDIWRRKIMQNKEEYLIKFCRVFRKGCQEKGILNDVEIDRLICLIRELLPISYLKAQSLCYSIVAYWGAFYKTHFRHQFNNVFAED